MSDRIKQYRVWCPTLREMLYDFKVEQEFWHPGSSNHPTASVKVYTTWGTPMQPPYIFMESIGLNDKNARVIFDGDIVSDPGSNMNQVEFIVIQHDNDGIGWNGYKVKNIDHCEVVGNIFENPGMVRISQRNNQNAQPLPEPLALDMSRLSNLWSEVVNQARSTTPTPRPIDATPRRLARRPARPRVGIAMDNNHTGEQLDRISQHITDSIRLADQAQRSMIIDYCNSLEPGQSYTTRDSNQIREIMQHDWSDDFSWEHNTTTEAIIITRRQDPRQCPPPEFPGDGCNWVRAAYFLPPNVDTVTVHDQNQIREILANRLDIYEYIGCPDGSLIVQRIIPF